MIEIKLTLTEEQAEELYGRLEKLEKDVDTILKGIWLINNHLEEEKDLSMRLDVGSKIPAGECLKCGAFSYVVEGGAA